MNRRDRRFKSLGEIQDRVGELVEEGLDGDSALETLRAELIEYYSTPEGREEIDASPHSRLRTTEAVDLLLDGWVAPVAATEVKKVKERRERLKGGKGKIV